MVVTCYERGAVSQMIVFVYNPTVPFPCNVFADFRCLKHFYGAYLDIATRPKRR